MEWLWEKLAGWYRPYHQVQLPEDLANEELSFSGITRVSMLWFARLAVPELKTRYHVFDVIGLGYAQRASRAWWPYERLLMEDVSCFFEPVEE